MKTAFALAVIMLLVVVVFPRVRFADANIIPYPDMPSTELPTLIIRSPENYSGYYVDNTFKLDFTIIKPESWDSYYKGFALKGQYMFYVYLDGNRSLPQVFPINGTVTDYTRLPRSNTVTDYTFIFRNLTDTEHVLHIVVEAMASYMGYFSRDGHTVTTGLTNNTYITQTIHFQLEPDSKTVSFQKDPQVVSRDPYPNPPTPVPIILSLQNTSYTIDDITQFKLPLNFTINATASWMGYSLDNQSRITINGNTTLTVLSIGSHNITLFASGTFGNMGISNTTFFTIEELPITFPTTLVATASLVTASMFAVFLFYQRKHKH